MTQTLPARSLALFVVAAVLAVWLDQPAQAHGIAHAGFAAGFLHPIRGVDHGLLLIAIAAAASRISMQLLLWGLAGAIAGGVSGAMGATLPAQELVAALAISAVSVLVLRTRQSPQLGVCGVLVAAAAAVHAMLHGLEAPADGSAALWWLGALAGSLLVSGGSVWLLRRLPHAWMGGLALVLALSGALAALGPAGLLLR
jgi:urease accessory protein